MTMGYKPFELIFDVFIFLSVFNVCELTVFECHGDWCNVGDTQQFCSVTFQICRNCHEIKDSCGSAAQPLNCTRYCQEMAVEEALKEKDDRDKKSCFVVPIMLNIANGNVAVPNYNDSRVPAGSELVYSCDSGYSLEGPNTLTCAGNGTWSQAVMPYCFQNACTDYKYWIVGLGIFCCVCFMALVLSVIKLYSCKVRANKGAISRTNTDDSLDKADEPLIDVENQNMYLENETPSEPVLPSGLEISRGDETDEGLSLVPVSPSAPPAESDKEEEDRNEPVEEGRSSSQDAGGPAKARNGSSTADKMPTEEVNEVNAVEETTDERDGKSMRTEARGPQPVTQKEEDIQTAIIETGQGNTSDSVGFQNVTFPKTDIKASEDAKSTQYDE